MPLNIGFLTSLGVNVGDEFIREGIRAMLDALDLSYRPFYVHKLDEASLAEPREDEPFRVSDKYWDCDLFIQAGAPVYWHLLDGNSTSLTSAWHKWMWEDRILDRTYDGPTFLNLGAGTCQPWNDDGAAFLADAACVDFARRASARAALTTVRDPLASHILGTLRLPHELLPCPAFLAAARHRIAGGDTGIIGVNLMPLGGHYQLDRCFDAGTWLLRCMAIVTRLRSFGRLLFVAHDAAEAAFMSQFAGPAERVFLAASWRDYLDVYGACRAVVANRVHGAVCAAGFGTPAIIIGNDSRAAIGDPIGIPRFKAGDEVESVFRALETLLGDARREADRLLSLRMATLVRYGELLRPIVSERPPRALRKRPPSPRITARVALGAVRQIEEPGARQFMKAVNLFASRFGMRQFHDWSKVWEYPWLWLNGLGGVPWPGVRVVDLGSELSPMPWLLASLGAEVVLIETDPRFVANWERWRRELQVSVRWHIVNSEALPISDGWADVVTSFSVIEHQADKAAAIDEAVRVLAPGGLVVLSFDICEPAMGMTFPEWNGRALTMLDFEELVWRHPAFAVDHAPAWNVDDIAAFREWHLKSAPYHNYVVAAAVLQKAAGDRAGVSWDTRAPPSVTRTSAIGVADFSAIRVKDLMTIREALHAYHHRHDAFPRSSGGWDGLYTNWGTATQDWIPALVPDHLSKLPRDPRCHERPDQQYLYKSDGVDYKVISHGPDDYAAVSVTTPEMIDPVRRGWAYGFWSEGAKLW